jgi:uncharacterized protein (TIGR02117 family)
MKRIALFFAGFLLVLAVTLCICFFVPRSPEHRLPPQSEAITFYVAQYVYHTGIILPVQTRMGAQHHELYHDWSKDFPCLQGCAFVEFGWGDRTFYMAGAETVGMALEALFASKASVASVVGLDAPINGTFATRPVHLRRVRVSIEEYERLVAFFVGTFLWSKGSPVFVREGFWGVRSAFYAANNSLTGQYSLINNCNVWSSNALHTASIRTPLWAGLPQPLVWMLPKEH